MRFDSRTEVEVGKSEYAVYYDSIAYTQNNAADFPCALCGYSDVDGFTATRTMEGIGEIINAKNQALISIKGSRGREIIKKIKSSLERPICDKCLDETMHSIWF